uniref:thermonuclease family protein n=1 Tax=Hylemonella sp. TaxID=2066020 RepID=UPI002601DC9D|nr:thermonuclease family protein [Hylemonella sp.]
MQTSIRWDAAEIPLRVQTWFRKTAALAALLLACLCPPALSATYTGRVVAISDGDTLTVLDAKQRQHKIRLAGIDAPEKRQAWGQRAQQFLGERVFQRVVRVEVSKTDRYGREIGKVLLDGDDINLELVRAGLAWHYRAYEREQPADEREQYAEAEQRARERRQGLWSDTQPVAPWDFRRRGRSGS